MREAAPATGSFMRPIFSDDDPERIAATFGLRDGHVDLDARHGGERTGQRVNISRRVCAVVYYTDAVADGCHGAVERTVDPCGLGSVVDILGEIGRSGIGREDE